MAFSVPLLTRGPCSRGRGERDRRRYRGVPAGDYRHPGAEALAKIREAELRAAAAVLGVHDVSLLDYHDQALDSAAPHRAIADIAAHLRRVRPDVVVTFGPDGAYGHPDHIAICQFTTAAFTHISTTMRLRSSRRR